MNPANAIPEPAPTQGATVAQVLEKLREVQEILSNLPTDPNPHSQQFDNLVVQFGARERELAEIQQAKVAGEQALAAVQREHEQARILLEELQAKISEVQVHLEVARQEAEESTKLVAQGHAVKNELAALERSREEAAQKLEQLHSLEAENARCREVAAAAQRFAARIWPAWFKTDDFGAWRNQLEERLQSLEPSAAATLLFAAIHGYNAALREASDSRVLLDSLRELSRRLFAWLKEQGLDETAAAVQAQHWAAEINRECAGKAEVDIPMPGNPADNSWMIFPPRTGGSDVVSVQTWCVRDGQKRPINKAQVTV